MSWKKRNLIEQAYAEINLAGYVFDLSPEDMMLACRRLDSLVGQWQLAGIRLGYPLASTPDDTDPDQDSNIPDDCNMAVYQLLAVAIAPTIGKSVLPSTAAMATRGYNMMLSKYSQPIKMQFRKDLPRGAGNKPWRGINREYFQETDSIAVGPDGKLV